jgi:hypothetical protein
MSDTTPEGSAPPELSGAAHSSRDAKEGYSVPLPEVVPRPTWWPAATALGIMLFAWGLVTSLIIFLIGMALFVTSVSGWIGEIRHERSQA